MLYKLALLTLNILKLITIIYALILFFNISSNVRYMEMLRKKSSWEKIGGMAKACAPQPKQKPHGKSLSLKAKARASQ